MQFRTVVPLAGVTTALTVVVMTTGAGARSLAPPDWDGDGAVATDCRPLDPAVFPGAPDKPDANFEDSNCDGIDGNVTDAVFVAPAGNNANPGTRTEPVASIATALGLVRGTTKDIYVAT